MSRLIDSDKLEETLADRVSFGEIGKLEYRIITDALMYNADEVKAIPIDWMKKKIEEHKDNPFQDVYDAFRTVLTIWEHETEGKR